MTKPHILIYTDCFVFGGCENVVLNLYDIGLETSGWKTTVLVAKNRVYETGLRLKRPDGLHARVLPVMSVAGLSHRLMRRFNESGRKAIARVVTLAGRCVEASGVMTMYNVCLLVKVFHEARGDILYINNGGYPGAASCRAAVLAARIAGVRNIVMHVNNLASVRSGWIRGFEDRLMRSSVSMFITGSFCARQRLSDALSIPLSCVVRIPNTPPREHLPQAGAASHMDVSCLRVSSIGLLTMRKGHIWLLHALRRLMQGELNCKSAVSLTIYGDGEELGRLKEYVQVSGLLNVVRFGGHVKDIASIMSHTDLLVHPSISDEDFPYVIVEAMAHGVPVVGTRVGGIPEQVEHGETGWLVDPGDVDSLARAVNEAMADRTLLLEMGVRARARYEEQFSREVVASMYRHQFRRLIEEGRGK